MQYGRGLSNVVFCKISQSFHHYLFTWTATAGGPLATGFLTCASTMAVRAVGELTIALVHI